MYFYVYSDNEQGIRTKNIRDIRPQMQDFQASQQEENFKPCGFGKQGSESREFKFLGLPQDERKHEITKYLMYEYQHTLFKNKIKETEMNDTSLARKRICTLIKMV
jgi:hypothetical protein